MADIHVQPKKHNTSQTWIWILIALLIAAVVVYFVVANNDENRTNVVNENNTTSYLNQPEQAFTTYSLYRA